MNIPAFLPLCEALTVLSAKSGQTWTRSGFFGPVVDRGLPMRGITPETARPVIAAGEGYVSANLPYRGRRLAVLSTPQTKDLWLYGEAKTRSVALEPGEPGYLDWDGIKVQRAALDRSAHPPESWNSESPDGDWHDGEFMGECGVSLFSEVVRVTDDTCLVPRETIEELLAVSAGHEDARATLSDGRVNQPVHLDAPEDEPLGRYVSHPVQEEPPATTSVRAVPHIVPAHASVVGTPAATDALAGLFAPVTPAVLERMFPAGGKWVEWAERAARNGLKEAREGRALFNPYLAALWFLQRGEPGWDLARCYRVLASNLPARSRGEDYKLTGLLD